MATADARIRITAEDKSARAFRSLQQRMGKTQRMMDGMLKGFAMLGGAAGIGRFITSTVKSADSLQKLSIKLGTTTDFLSKLRYAANISGVEMNTVAKALEKMQKSASDAGRGLSTARDGFATLGIEVEQFINLSPEQQFQLMIEKLGGVANQSIRTGTAMDLMGRSGAEMLKIVAGGPQVFNDLMLKAEDLGGVLKQDTADGAAAVADAFTDVSTVWSGLLRDAVLNATDGFIAFANVLRDAGAFVREYSTQIKFVAVVLVELFVIRKITALIVAMSGAMKVATFSAKGLGLALKGMLGGIPGLLAIAGTAWLMLRDDTDEATQAIDQQTEAVKELRQQFAGMNLDQLTQRQRELKTEFAEVSAELEQLNQDLEEMRRLMANAPGGKGMIEAARDLQTAIVDAGDAVSVLEDPQLVALQDRYAELEALLAEVEKQIDEVTKSTDESTKAHKKNADAVEKVVKGLTEGDKAAMAVARAILAVNEETIKVEKSLTEAEQALKDFGDGVIDAQKESDLLIDKMELLDGLFRDGKISGEVYEDTLRGLGDAFGDAADDGVALVEVVEETKTVFEDLVDGIDGSWTQMWKDLFGGGKTEDVLKGFLDRVKKMFLDTLAEIVAAWTKKKIIEMITGGGSGGGNFITSILGSAGGSGGSGSPGIGSLISSAVSKIGGSIFGAGTTSSGVLGATGIIGTTGSASAAAAGASSLGGATAAGAGTAAAGLSGLGAMAGIGIAGIAIAGFLKGRKYRKELERRHNALMQDQAIVSNMATEEIIEGYIELGQRGESAFLQVSQSARRLFQDHLGQGLIDAEFFGVPKLADEFGNVILQTQNLSATIAGLNIAQPFIEAADALYARHGAMTIWKESIEVVDEQLFNLANRKDSLNEMLGDMERGFIDVTDAMKYGIDGRNGDAQDIFQKMIFDVAAIRDEFVGLGEAGKMAIGTINLESQQLQTVMEDGWINSLELAELGLSDLGEMSTKTFTDMVEHVKIAQVRTEAIAAAVEAGGTQFENLDDKAYKALMTIDLNSQMVQNTLRNKMVDAIGMARLGFEDFGVTSTEALLAAIEAAQKASDEFRTMTSAANEANAAGQRARGHMGDGMQHGGSFLVGGGGGTDSQRVSFMATPGERVTVETPNQSRASGSDGGNVVRELRALRHDLASVVAKPIVGAVTRGQLAMAGGARH